MGMNFVRKLPIPMEVKEKYPLPYDATEKKEAWDNEIRAIIAGESAKKLVVVGPCSADREDAVLEYAEKLRALQEEVKDQLRLVMRVYTNKPRTTGDGYKGMLHQPDPNGKPDLFHGILAIRSLHLRVITECDLPTADEMLYPFNYRYLSDLLSYIAVGARSLENQEHRLTASGFSIPVGMKNPTAGDLSVMMNSITAAQHPHAFIYRGWEVNTDGNPYAHAILRGFVNQHGQSMPNYHYEDLVTLAALYEKANLQNPALIVDANHANSGKKYAEQPRIVKEVLHAARHNDAIASLVKGFMIESYLVDGNQKTDGSVYGQSITDPCLGFEKTRRLILDMAELV